MLNYIGIFFTCDFIAKHSECEGSELPPYVLDAKEMCHKAKEEEPLTLEEKTAKLKYILYHTAYVFH